MDKQQFLNKWHFTGHCLISQDLDAVIAHEIAKAQPEKQKTMVQEKQLRELFKYIEANWDVCVEDVDKRDIKRIFGGVLCDDIMNDTLHEIKSEPALNPIAEAYERGEKIRAKFWKKGTWAIKNSDTHAVDEKKVLWNVQMWDFKNKPEKWELYTEPTEQHSSQVKLDNSFDKERFEAMFRAVVASGDVASTDFFSCTIDLITKLDAYYASKEGDGKL